MQLNNIDRTSTRELSNRFNKSVYEQFKSFGILLKVKSNKLPYGSWNNKTVSDIYNSTYNYALIIKKNQDNPKHLVVLDVDIKKGAKGEDSLFKLSSEIAINLYKYKTCITPSQGYHIYIISNEKPIFPNKFKIKGLTEDIDIFCENNRDNKNTNYFLLPTNKGVISKDAKGNKIIGEYKYNKNKVITGEIANKIINQLNSLYTDSLIAQKNNIKKEENNKIDNKQLDNNEIAANRNKITTILPYLSQYADDYNDWVNIGGHIKKAGGNLKLFDEFSKLSKNKYNKNAVNEKYNLLPVDEGMGMGSLIFLARKEFINELKNKINNVHNENEFKSLFKQDYFKNFINSKFLLNDEVKEEIINIFKDGYFNIMFNEPDEKDINYFIFDIDGNDILNEYIPNTKDKYSYFDLSTVLIAKPKGGYDMTTNPIDARTTAKNIKTILTSLYPTTDEQFIYIKNNELIRMYNIRDNRSIKNFTNMLLRTFPKIPITRYKGFAYKELFKIENLRQHLLNGNNYIYTEVKDLVKSGIKINHEDRIITNYKKFKLNNKIDEDITHQDKNYIVKVFNEHWKNMLVPITKWLILSRYLRNIKHKNIAIIAPSNTGKTFYFRDILKTIGVVSWIKIEDYAKNGTAINNFTLDEVSNKYANIFDETHYFKRDLFDISNELTVRPLFNQNIRVKVGAKVFLSADGGHFKSDYLDTQLINRITILDFEDIKVLNNNPVWKEITDKYSENNVNDVLIEYFYNTYKEYITKLNNMSNKELAEEEKKINNFIINSEYKQNQKDSNERLSEVIDEFLNNPDVIPEHLNNMIFNKISINKKNKKMVILNARKVINIILDVYDSDLAKDKKYLQLDTIVKHVDRFINKRGTLRFKKTRKTGLIVDLKDINLDYFENNTPLAQYSNVFPSQ